VTIIETADGEEWMRSTHKCIKTYFVRNLMGDPVPISVPALFVRGVHQDLIGGKAVNKLNIRATGNEMWHQRLGHVPFRNIEQTIQHSIGFGKSGGKEIS
jgi:hypothetical protein